MSIVVSAWMQRILRNVEQVIIGKSDVAKKLCISCICGGHVLLEDIPGTGKTTLAKALAVSTGCSFSRVQFTPDLLPSDVTGINFYDQKLQEFRLKKGPVFTNILLADEINRATPRTQSSLLECMQERQVTIDGVTYPLAAPFLVIATQNPIETQGTFPLPEAQLDRFFMRLSMGYPSPECEADILANFAASNPLETLTAVTSAEEIVQVQQHIRTVTASRPVRDYIVALASATRTDPNVSIGISPRGTLALLHAAQAAAAIQDRSFILPDDVQEMVYDVWKHRILCRGSGILKLSDSAKEVLDRAVASVPVPVV